MLNEQTLATLNGMKLFGMAQSLPQRLADPKQAELSHAEFAALLAQDEKMHRDNRRLARLLKHKITPALLSYVLSSASFPLR